MAGHPSPLRYFMSWDDPARPSARLRLLIEMGAPPKRLHEELDRMDRFLVKVVDLHLHCDRHVVPLKVALS